MESPNTSPPRAPTLSPGDHQQPVLATTTSSTPPSCASTDKESSSPASAPSLPPAHVNDKHFKSERQRRSRLNRITKHGQMRAHVASLERTALALRVASDADTIWDEFLDDDTKRTRAHLRWLVTATNQVKQLTSAKAQLQRLLTERELARRAVARMVEAMETANKWDTSCALWKALARARFRPLTTSECMKLIDAAHCEMAEYVGRTDKQSSGVTFMGWQEVSRLVPEQLAVQYSLHKTYRGYDLNRLIEMTWRVYSEPELYSKVILGGRGRLSMDILQKISPTAWVVRIVTNYDEMDVAVHDLFLLVRINTDDGVIMFARSFQDPGLQRAIKGPRDLWMSISSWMRWEVLDPLKDWNSTDFRVSIGGSLHVGHSGFLYRWLFDLVAIVVRSEGVLTGRPMLKFSW